MNIRIFNTLTGNKEPFNPIEPGKVRMYVCGPTVYDYSHIGHARSVVVFDVIARYLKNCMFDVTYVRNFTDVDDKIINRANEQGVNPFELSENFIDAFHEDMDALNVLRPDHAPKVTQYIEEIKSFVEKLIQSGHAYEVEGDVYYAVESFPEYGKLSGRKLEDMEAGARVDVDRRKRNPFDFALWKAAKPGEPSWESPWGPGRPGWHIECSAMSNHLLGETFDIHGGGKDLIFPHHENEIAQSEGACGKPFANYWIHNGFVNIDQEKMSKSLGNFKTIREVIQTYHPEVVRLFLLSSHYRSPLDFSENAMEDAKSRLNRLYGALKRIEDKTGPLDSTAPENRPYYSAFCDAMNDDFNTALGLATLFEGIRKLNAALDEEEVNPDSEKLAEIREAGTDIFSIGREILGIFSLAPDAYFEQQREDAISLSDLSADEIDDLVAQRTAARKAKDWATADAIRKRLDELNVQLEDRPDGTIWKMGV